MPSSPNPTPIPPGDFLLDSLRKGLDWVHAVESRDINTIRGRHNRLAFKALKVILLVARFDVVQQLQLHAQALTYDTLLALVPLMAVVFAMVSGFGGMHDLRQRIEELILSNISGSDEVRAAISAYLTKALGTIRSGGFSALSIVILVYSVLSLLGHIEFAINSVFGTKPDRPWVSRLITYWAALTLGPLLLGATFAVTSILQTAGVTGYVESSTPGAILLRVLPFVLTVVAFASLYVIIPTTPVKISAALFAATISGGLWTLAKVLYAVYARRTLSVQNIYGSLVTVPLFILWIYVSWLLVLLGAQLAFAFQNASTYYKDTLALASTQTYRERVACRTFLEIGRDFFHGRPPTHSERLATGLGIPRRLLEVVLASLESGGFIRVVGPDAAGELGFIPSRDLAKVSIADVVTHFRSGIGVQLSMQDDEARRQLDGILDATDRELARHAGTVSFRELAERLPLEDKIVEASAPAGTPPATDGKPGAEPPARA